MKKAPLLVNETEQKRLAFAGMLMQHVGVLPDEIIAKFSRNEFRAEIPDRLLFGFTAEDPKLELAVSSHVSESESMDLMVWLDKWPEFCKQFGLAIEVDFATLKETKQIKNRKSGFNWLVYCPKSLTTRQALDLCKKQGFKVWEEIPVEQYSLERAPFKTDLVLCCATTEPDKEWLGKSADDMSATKTPFLDARERYMLEAFYFWLTGKHLDISGWTRCSRSRTSDGRVASAVWLGDEFRAGWRGACDRFSRAGGREAVILKT